MASLAALCLGLSAVIATEWLDGQDDAIPPAPPPANAPPSSTTANFAMPALAAYAEVLSRPLFSPNRRPSEEAPAATVSTSMTLVAILISPRGPHALVRHGTPPQLDRLVEGQTIEGWTTEEIKFDRVILRRGTDTLELVPISAEQPQQPKPTPLPFRPPLPPRTSP